MMSLVPNAGTSAHEAGSWQRRRWEQTIRGTQDYAVHLDHTHFNPATEGLAARPADWPFSSFARCVKFGAYPIDWAIEGQNRRTPVSGCNVQQ